MPRIKQIHNIYHTIPNGAAYASEPIDLRLIEPVSLVIPGSWTEAAISFSGSPDGLLTNYGWLAQRSGKIAKIALARPNNSYQLPRSWFNGVNYLYVISGDLGLGLAGLVNQTADRKLLLVCRDRFGTEVEE